jgi:hypothetical protein
VLQGTFDTLALTEVLGLLGQSSKTGALWLEAGPVQGRIYLADGRCCAAESGELTEPVDTEAALTTRLVDVCFTLARHHGGAFRFAAGEAPTWKVTPGVDIEDAIVDLERLLGEWREIQLVIPSLEVRPRLAPELGVDEIILDQERWRLLVTLDGRRTVRSVMNRMERGVLEVCNALKELVEQGAVEILPEAPAPVATAPEPAAVAESEPTFEAAAEDAAAVEDVPAADDAVAVSDEPAADGVSEWQPAGELATPDTDLPNARRWREADDEEMNADRQAFSEMPDPFAGADEEAEHVPGSDGVFAAPTGADAFDEGDPRDRGALLRLFSALRDT